MCSSRRTSIFLSTQSPSRSQCVPVRSEVENQSNWRPTTGRREEVNCVHYKMKNGRDSHDIYKYVTSDSRTLDKVIHVHDVFIKRSKLRLFFSYIARLILLANLLLLLIDKDKLSIGSFWRLFLCVVSTKLLQYKPIKKESVVIMPSFGVQLETHYWSGRIDRKFIPIGKILKPVLNECVTPVTCYWSLVLVLRDEDQLTLVFQKLRPPFKILLPVWKALCKSTNLEDRSHS